MPKGGASAPPRRGDKRLAGFHIGWCFCESPHCESLSHGFAVPAPFSKGALRAVPAANAHGNLQRIVTAPPVPGNVTAVVVEAPHQSPPCQRGVVLPPAKPGGFPRAAGFHIGWCFCESPHCESLSQKSKIFASSLSQGSYGVQRKKGPVANALQQAQAIYDCYSSSGKVYCLRYFSKRSSNLALSVSSPAFRAVRYSWASSLPSDTWSISTAMLEQWSATRS